MTENHDAIVTEPKAEEAGGCPVAHGRALRVGDGHEVRQQVGLGQREREDNVRGAFRVPAEAEIRVGGRNVLLVDDVYTTGATVSAVTKALKKAGAGQVDVLTFARVIPGDFQPGEAATI